MCVGRKYLRPWSPVSSDPSRLQPDPARRELRGDTSHHSTVTVITHHKLVTQNMWQWTLLVTYLQQESQCYKERYSFWESGVEIPILLVLMRFLFVCGQLFIIIQSNQTEKSSKIGSFLNTCNQLWRISVHRNVWPCFYCLLNSQKIVLWVWNWQK